LRRRRSRLDVDPLAGRIETPDLEQALLAESQYLARASRWWIPERTQRHVAGRRADIDVGAMRRETSDRAFHDRTDRVVDDERRVHHRRVQRLAGAGAGLPPFPAPRRRRRRVLVLAVAGFISA